MSSSTGINNATKVPSLRFLPLRNPSPILRLGEVLPRAHYISIPNDILPRDLSHLLRLPRLHLDRDIVHLIFNFTSLSGTATRNSISIQFARQAKVNVMKGTGISSEMSGDSTRENCVANEILVLFWSCLTSSILWVHFVRFSDHNTRRARTRYTTGSMILSPCRMNPGWSAFM
jgi:hypothetical protein